MDNAELRGQFASAIKVGNGVVDPEFTSIRLDPACRSGLRYVDVVRADRGDKAADDGSHCRSVQETRAVQGFLDDLWVAVTIVITEEQASGQGFSGEISSMTASHMVVRRTG